MKLNQPYGRVAKTLLKLQNNYPDENLTTYDDAAWTMGLMTHTNVVEVDDKAVLDASVSPLQHYDLRGSMSGPGPGGYAVLDNGSVRLPELRYKLKGVTIKVADRSFKVGKTTVPAGSFLIPASAGGDLRPLVDSLGLTAIGAPANPGVPTHEITAPRVAVYSTWGATQDVGWVRYAFDQYDTPYDLIYKEQVRGGNLRAKYDVIILPEQGRSPKDIVFDIPMKGKPLPYEQTAQYKSLGMYGSSPDIRGGMGLQGLEELKKFVDQGGILITTGNASAVPVQFGLVDDVSVSNVSKNFYAPGPIVKAKLLQPLSPIFYGYTEQTMPVRWATNELFSADRTHKANVLMEFPGGKDAVMSGFIKGADEVKNRAAIIDMPEGQGRVVMFATNPIWRWQNLGEFRMLYNAMLNWRDLGGPDNLSPQKADLGLPADATPVYDTGDEPTVGQ